MPDADKTVYAWTNPTYDASAPARRSQGGTHYMYTDQISLMISLDKRVT